MVKEISLEKYQKFCEYLPCKDVFYFLDNLFVQFPYDENIYGVKYNVNSTPKKVYEKLQQNHLLEVQTLQEFLSGIPKKDNKVFVEDELYRHKSILVVIK